MNMRREARRDLLAWRSCAVCAAVGSAAGRAAQSTAAADAFAAPGVALAWGSAARRDEAATAVVVRVVTDPATYPWLAVRRHRSLHPGEQPLLQRATTRAGTLDVRIAARAVRRHPRTELRFFASAAAAPSRTRRRSSSTTSAFPTRRRSSRDAAKLDAYLAARIARARAAREPDAMTRSELARLLDHSVLKPESTAADIAPAPTSSRTGGSATTACSRAGCALAAGALAGTDARSPAWSAFRTAAIVADVKASAAALAVADGASEIDMVHELRRAARRRRVAAGRRRHRGGRARRATGCRSR